MEQRVFESFRDLIYRESGITLKQEKIQLLSARIQKRIYDLQLGSAEAYFDLIESDLSGNELVLLLDSVSTNLTFFFREEDHFRFLNEQIQRWNNERRSRIRLWCAAASSGQEPYTIAICLAEHLNSQQTNCRLLATDLCTKVLEQAVVGEYPQQEVSKVPSELAKKYFKKQNNNYVVSQTLKDFVTFQKLNLVHIPYPMKGPIDIIFCRNVMIYFDLAVRQKIITEMARLIPSGGYLILSHSESLMGLDVPFKRVENSIFQRN